MGSIPYLTIQPLIVHMCFKFRDFSLNRSWEFSDIFNVSMQNREARKCNKTIEEYEQWAQVSIPRYNHSFFICVLSLKKLICTIPEKTVTLIFLAVTEEWNSNGKHKSRELDSQFHDTTTHLSMDTKVQESCFNSLWGAKGDQKPGVHLF